MKKIMFDDRYRLTKAVLYYEKTNTRRIIRLKDGEYVVVVQLGDGEYMSYVAKDGKPTAYVGALEMPNFVRPLEPKYFIGEVVAVAQSYRDVSNEVPMFDTKVRGKEYRAGWGNKMFVKAELMPHHIRITNIRVERLQNISDEDCMKEGIKRKKERFVVENEKGVCFYTNSAQLAFIYLINKVSGKGTWDSNPYVFVYEFERVD